MALSKEVQQALDEIKRNKSLADSTAAADKLRDQKIKDQQAQIDDLKSQIAAIPVNQEMSQEDKDALTQGVTDLKNSGDELAAINSQLQTAVPDNTPGPTAADNSSSNSNSGQTNQPPQAPEPGTAISTDEQSAANGPANVPAGGFAPLHPTLAFDPDPTGGRGVGNPGQPNQPAAIPTPGGFVVTGGGTTQRAAGSAPESPSSSIVIPTDPDAKAPASTADVVKSGYGDSSQNAMVDADGKQVITDNVAGQTPSAPVVVQNQPNPDASTTVDAMAQQAKVQQDLNDQAEKNKQTVADQEKQIAANKANQDAQFAASQNSALNETNQPPAQSSTNPAYNTTPDGKTPSTNAPPNAPPNP